MGRSCYVPYCKTGYRSQRHKKCSLFKVPPDKVDEWQKAIGRKDRILSTKDSVCEKHFLSKYILREINTVVYSYPLPWPKLTKDAVPTLFPDRPSSSNQGRIERRLAPKCLPLKEEKSESNFELKQESIEGSPPEYPPKEENFELKEESIEIGPIEYLPKEEEIESNFEFIDIPVPDKDEDVSASDETTETPLFVNTLETTFLQIFENFLIIELPSQAWAVHKHIKHSDKPCPCDIDGLICISEMTETEDNNMVVRKKIILNKTTIKTFVFDRLIDNSLIFTKDCGSTIPELEAGLKMFDRLAVCWGGLSTKDVESDFKNSSYFVDGQLNVWRHVECPYILESENNSVNKRSTCFFCKKFKKAVVNYKYHLARTANRVSRVEMALKRAGNVRKREKRLRLQNQLIMKELEKARSTQK